MTNRLNGEITGSFRETPCPFYWKRYRLRLQFAPGYGSSMTELLRTSVLRSKTCLVHFSNFKAIGLEVNLEKTKYMLMSRDQNIVRIGNVELEIYPSKKLKNSNILQQKYLLTNGF
ncbi:hypothetical protein ANN_03188 [Periplaneta americana]|uniref:Uncharacterized protein n=1 Tax=Periplaneta americana TaxID=6978 RepID=A0ABQ8TZI9_PERAM|nr:hypothetical protein ANN_03188 [Periplaneta americana]